MSKRLQEIECRFNREVFRNGSFVIATGVLCNGSQAAAEKAGHIGTEITLKGDAEPDELEANMTYRFYGLFQRNKFKRKAENVEEVQFQFSSHVPALAHDKEGVIAYLESTGRGLGVGIGTAKKAWDKWGSDAVRTIRENPQVLLELNKRLSDDDLAGIKMRLDMQAKTEAAQIEVISLLSGRGFPKSVFKKAIRAWGNQAAETIRQEPYRLMKFRGCGWKLTDKLYLELGLDPKAIVRQALCAWYAIASKREGDVWFPIEVAKHAVRAAIGAGADPDAAIKYAVELGTDNPNHYGALSTIRTRGTHGPVSDDGDKIWIAEGRNARAENRLAGYVVDALEETKPQQITQYAEREMVTQDVLDHARCRRCSRPLTAPEVHVWNGKPFGPNCINVISDGTDVTVMSLQDWLDANPVINRVVQEVAVGVIDLPQFSIWPEINSVGLISDHQREALNRCLVGRLAILCGSPGTGKTFTLAMLVKSLLASGRVAPEDIAIGTPTGKAAVRLNEALTAARVPVRAKTWHSLLGRAEQDEESGNWSFAHNEQSPWPYKVIIGDEESMRDLPLFCATMAARARGCHYLLVGDPNQLPPVGCGAPLRDLIAAGLPCAELTEIKRNSGGIVEACKAIKEGRRWEEGDNFKLIHAKNPDAAMESIVEQISILSADRGDGTGKSDPVWDCQVIVAVNKKSPLSRVAVNKRLQGELNSNQSIEGCPFRLHDKVVCVENSWFPRDPEFDAIELDEAYFNAEKDEIYAANGEIGKVLAIEEKKLIVELFHPSRQVIVPRGKQDDAESDDDEESKSSTGCKFDLAYALTNHKMQGSECRNVIYVVDEYRGALNISTLESIYTGWSRAKHQLRTIGKRHVIDSICKHRALPRRKTFLRELILKKQAERMLEGL